MSELENQLIEVIVRQRAEARSEVGHPPVALDPKPDCAFGAKLGG
jgi:hypothetical protein